MPKKPSGLTPRQKMELKKGKGKKSQKKQKLRNSRKQLKKPE